MHVAPSLGCCPSPGLQSSGEFPGMTAWDSPQPVPGRLSASHPRGRVPNPTLSFLLGERARCPPGCWDGSVKVLQWLAYRKLSPLMRGLVSSRSRVGRVGG